MKKSLFNSKVTRSIFLICGLLLITSSAWGEGSDGYFYYYYAKVTAKTAQTSSGQGSVYVSTTAASVTDATASTSTATGQDPNNYGESTDAPSEAGQVTFYLYAKPADGYKFDGWSSSATRPDVFESTNPEWQTTFGASTTQGINSTTKPDGKQNSGSTASDGKTQYYYTSTAEYTIYAYFSEKAMNFSVSFVQPSNGSISIDGTVPASWPYVVNTTTGELNTTLIATPASSYRFWGWYTLNSDGSKNYLSYDATYNASFNDGTTVYAEFCPSSYAIFEVAGIQYYDLNKANAKAVANGGGKIAVVQDGVVPAGNYTIESGVTLLVPFDAGYTIKNASPSYTYNGGSYSNPSIYRTLTFESGVTLNVSGVLEVGAQNIYAGGGSGGNGGRTLGTCGRLQLNNGSKINLNNGSKLYTWGYITGNGTIDALNGSEVREPFQFEFRGGSHVSAVKSSVLPLNQYYVQNIEAPITFYNGSKEVLFTAAYAASQTASTNVTFIGTDGLFILESGSTLTKHYDGTQDRQVFDIDGNSSLQSITVSVAGYSMSSSSVVLPITNNMILNVHSGTTSILYATELLADAKVVIDEGAKVKIRSDLFIYDRDEWVGKNCAKSGDLVPITYSPTKTVTRNSDGIVDATLMINGTLEMYSGEGKKGYLYTTTGGANITSSGTGKIILTNGVGSKTITKQNVGVTKKTQDIPVTPAQLHNASQWYTAPYTGDNACEYLATAGAAANTTITYAHGHWGWIGIWKNWDGTILKVANTCLESELAAKAPTPNPTRPDEGCTIYTFNSWFSDSNETNQEIVYTATYDESTRTYSIAYEAGADGTGTVEGGTKTCGTDFTLSSSTFTRTGYTQTGWSTTDGGTKAYELGGTYTANADITLYPFWSPNTNTAYTVKHFLQNIDGTYPSEPEETDNLTGTTGASVTPAVKSYSGFTAPTTQTAAILADGSLVITYRYTRNSYTLTWDANGGKLSGDYTSGSVKYGATITAPTAIRDGYDFAGWNETPAATMPAEAKTYTAQWTVAEAGFYVDIVDVDNSAKTLTLNVTGWASSGWPYTVNSTSYEKTARQTDRTLIIPYTGNVGESMTITVQKTGGDIVSKHNYIVPAAITSDAALGDQQMIFVKPNTTLTVDADKTIKNIYVAPGAKLVVNAGVTLKADTVFLRTTPWLSAELELNGSISGQVCYTRIICKKDAYYQFGLPMSCPIASVRLSDGTTPVYGNGWLLRSYSEASRAQNGTGADIDNWVTLTSTGSDDAEIQGCVGYEMFSNSGYYREYYFPVAHTDLASSVAVTHTTENTKGAAHEGWNIVCSPLMRTYTQSPAPEGLVFSWLQEDGSYIQQPVEEVKPAIPFSYQAKDNGNISFGATMAAPAPRRVAASEEQTRIQWIQLDVTDAKGESDHAGIYSHPTRYEDTYKAGIDVAKQSLTASRAILYSSHVYGEMAFAGVSDSLLESGIALTVYSPAEQKLTLSMRENEWLNRMEYVWLIDNETGARTDLLWNDYSFRASEGTTSGRFVILGRFFAPQITTDMEPVSDSSSNGAKARKVLMGQKMYIIVGEQIYDGTGKLVNK